MKAIEYFERALAIDEKLGRLEGQANQLCELGLCDERLCEPATALDFLTRARALYRRMGLLDEHYRVARTDQALARLR